MVWRVWRASSNVLRDLLVRFPQALHPGSKFCRDLSHDVHELGVFLAWRFAPMDFACSCFGKTSSTAGVRVLPGKSECC